MDNGVSVDVLDAKRILRKLSENETKDEGADNEDDIDLPSHKWKWISKNKDVEIACCEIISISSQGKTKEMYPFILGEYKQNKENLNSFVKIELPKLFLMQPETISNTWAYTWGVSRSTDVRWGYIRSARAKPCPTWAGSWMVYDRNLRAFVVDKTLQVACTMSL